MTFDTTVPNASQSPGLFPVQNSTNFTRLKTIINADHVFNDTAQSTDGLHRQCTMLTRAQPVALPMGSNAILYSWIDAFGQTQLRYYNGTNDFQLTPGIVAAVNFNGTGANGVKTMRSQLNVASVTKTGTGAYTIAFTTALPNNNYIVQCTGMRNAVGDVSNGYVKGDATYGNSVSTTFIKVEFNGGSSSLADVLMGNIVIMRYT